MYKRQVIASTASPYKFSGSVLEAIDGVRPEEDEFAIVDRLAELSGTVIPQAVEEIRTAPVRHTVQCDTDQMQATVAGICLLYTSHEMRQNRKSHIFKCNGTSMIQFQVIRTDVYKRQNTGSATQESPADSGQTDSKKEIGPGIK